MIDNDIERTGFVGEHVESTEVDDVDPEGRVIVLLGVVDEAKVDRAQHLNVVDIDWHLTKLSGNERHELHYVIDLQHKHHQGKQASKEVSK